MQIDVDREHIVEYFSFSVFFNVENGWDVRYITQRQFNVRNALFFLCFVFLSTASKQRYLIPFDRRMYEDWKGRWRKGENVPPKDHYFDPASLLMFFFKVLHIFSI